MLLLIGGLMIATLSTQPLPGLGILLILNVAILFPFTSIIIQELGSSLQLCAWI